MKKPKIKIKDGSFSHCQYSNNPLPPVSFCDHFEWDWNTSNIGNDEYVFYTHGDILTAVNDKQGVKIGWLLEPKELIPTCYEDMIKHRDTFKYIFTHDKSMLDLGGNFKYLPFGGCWIKPEDQKIYNKTKLVSIIVSHKRQLKGHKLRHETTSKYGNKLDVLGNGYRRIPEKVDGHRDYMFSVVIENSKADYYFTEKLIDSLVTGCIPIYWGCPSIGDFFNEKGFIIVDNTDNIGEALSKITPKMYEDMLPYVKENFEKAKEYILAENHIYENYIKTGKIEING